MCQQRPQPHYDFEIAESIRWLKSKNMTASVTLQGKVTFHQKGAPK